MLLIIENGNEYSQLKTIPTPNKVTDLQSDEKFFYVMDSRKGLIVYAFDDENGLDCIYCNNTQFFSSALLITE